MISPDTLFLYSTNAWLSFVINEEYYGGVHFAWVSPIFDTEMVQGRRLTNPPASTPKEICQLLQNDVSRGEKNSAKIAQVRDGIVRGAITMYGKSVISAKDLSDIKRIVRLSETRDFRPFVYVISYPLVRHLVQNVPIRKKGHPLSHEYVIESLPNSCFEALSLS